MKKDGHTHTEFCPHGTGEDVEQYILKAIDLGFTDYSITEHTPLPDCFIEKFTGIEEAVTTGGMNANDVEHYLKKMYQLKKKYEQDIRIHVGFEVDYLEGLENWTIDFLNEYGKYVDDSILSLHFMHGAGGFRSIDFSPEDYYEGIVQHYGSFQKAQEIYMRIQLKMINADLGPYKPKRVGHLTLCQKYQMFYKDQNTSLSETSIQLIDDILDTVKEKQMELDFNAAGLFKTYCNETYPPLSIMEKVKTKGVHYVYGSDSHGIDDVGRGYGALILGEEKHHAEHRC